MSEPAGLEFTRHARHAMAERKIAEQWVSRVVSEPDLRIYDPDDTEVERFYKSIPEQGHRVLRVAVNTRSEPWRVVSAFFDRGMRGSI